MKKKSWCFSTFGKWEMRIRKKKTPTFTEQHSELWVMIFLFREKYQKIVYFKFIFWSILQDKYKYSKYTYISTRKCTNLILLRTKSGHFFSIQKYT